MLAPQPNSENKAQVEQVEPSPIWGRVCMMLKAPTDSALEESDQDDPKNVGANRTAARQVCAPRQGG